MEFYNYGFWTIVGVIKVLIFLRFGNISYNKWSFIIYFFILLFKFVISGRDVTLGIDKGKDYHMGKDGILWFRNRVCVPWGPWLRKRILKEGHKSNFSIHPSTAKMYKNLKESFWWTGMKTNVADFVASCLVC